MSKWGNIVTQTRKDANEFWQKTSLEDMLVTLNAPLSARKSALRVASKIITLPGSVWEPGCGDGVLGLVLPAGCTYYGTEISPSIAQGARDLHAEEISKGTVQIDEGDFFEQLKTFDQRSFDWVVVVNLFGMFPEETIYEVLPDLWAVTNYGLSVTTFNAETYNFTRRAGTKNQFQSHKPQEICKAMLALPNAGAFFIDEQVKRYNGRKMCSYLYRDDFPGQTAKGVNQ
jgi:hypothetical protein